MQFLKGLPVVLIFVHPKLPRPITLAGQPSDDAKQYQSRAVKPSIEEMRK